MDLVALIFFLIKIQLFYTIVYKRASLKLEAHLASISVTNVILCYFPLKFRGTTVIDQNQSVSMKIEKKNKT